MNHPWQQPIRPMEYTILNSEPVPEGLQFTPLWIRVIFIRVTDDGFEVMGENGTRWNIADIVIREVAR